MTAPARTRVGTRPHLALRPSRPRRAAALTVPVVAVALLAACGTQSAVGTVDGLPVLRIGGAAEAGGVPAAADARSGNGWTLDGSLPTSPDSAPVARFDDGLDEADVRALATALGIVGQPERRAHGWVVEDRGGVLKVRDDAGGVWSFSRSGDECPAYSVDVESEPGYGVSSCAVAVSSGGGTAVPGTRGGDVAVSSDGVMSTAATDVSDAPTAVPGSSGGGTAGTAVAPSPPDQPTEPLPTEPGVVNPPPTPTYEPAPSEASALAAARPVLAAAGVEGDPRTYETGWGGRRSVVVDPRVAGLPTVGIRTVVDADADGVVGATGWLASASAGDAYPLLTAKDAFDRLAAQPRPLPAIACPQTLGQDDIATDGPALGAPEAVATASDLPLPCGEVPDSVVTGARLGLMLSFEGAAPLLVPAWLFEVRGWTDPVPVLAVPDKYLAQPEPAPVPTASSASVGPDPGATQTAAPPPTDPGTDPSTGSGGGVDGTVAVERAYLDRDGTTLALVGWGGACAEYSGIADESAEAVKVQVVGRSTSGPDTSCIEIAQEVKVVVTLSSPLGDRSVVDATTGREVDVQRT